MGKISNALKKVSEQRQEHLGTQKIQAKKQFSENIQKNDEIFKPNFNQDIESSKPTLKDRIDSLRYGSLYVARDSDATGIDPRIVTYFDDSSSVSEQYRILKTNIKSYISKSTSSSRAVSIKTLAPTVIALTSSLHNEGKSLTSVNLAVSLTKNPDNKVLIVDCDLRNGTVHKLLNVDPSPGLSDILNTEYDYTVALHNTAIKNLFVIPRGAAFRNPSEMLGSKKMRSVLESLKSENLTHIIIDTPPIVPFTDAQIICPQADAVMVVVQANRTQTKLVKRAKDLVQQSNGKFLGFVLTQTDYYVPDIHSYYYYHYYNRGLKDNNQKNKEN